MSWFAETVAVPPKTAAAESELLAAFKHRTIDKVYHALCFGAPETDGAVLTDYLRKDGDRSLVKIYSKPIAGAEKIVTEYKLLETRG